MDAPASTPLPEFSADAADSGPRDLWYVGAIVNVIGSIAINLGTNIMKLGHNKRAKLDMPEAQKPPIRKFKEWVVGMCFFSVGNILNFISFGFAAQSLLAALGSIQFVSNVIFAYFVLHEQINRMVLIATTCIVGGCVLLVVFGNQSSAAYTVKQLTQLYTKPAYITYLCLMAAGVVGGYLVYLRGQKMVSKNGQRGFWYAILPVAYSVFSALIGTQSVLFSKSMSVILRLSSTGHNQLGNWYTWLVLPLFLSTAVFWITRLNKCLRMFPAMIIVPVMQISWTLFSILSGMLYFQEYIGFTPLKSAMFPIGVLIVFIGVFLLTQAGATKQASYQKMEDGTAAKAALQDSATSAFGSSNNADVLEGRGSTSMRGANGEDVLTGTPAAAATAVVADSQEHPEKEDVDMQASATTPRAAQGLTSSFSPSTVVDIECAQPATSPLMLAEQEPDKPPDSPSIVDAMKRRLRSVQDKFNKDLLGMETRDTLRLAMGFGGGDVPAISLFAMPSVMDYAMSVNPSGRFSDLSEQNSLREGANPLHTIHELEGRTGSFSSLTTRQEPRTPRDQARGGSMGGSPMPQRPGMAPDSPVGGSGAKGLGRSLMNKAERAAKSGIQVLKRAPSNLQRAVRDKQGYGSLHDDEEAGLLELSELSGPASSSQR